MAVAAASGLIWRIKVSHAVATAIAPAGAVFTALALATGMLWAIRCGALTGRGTIRAWCSELVLLFLFLGYLALRSAIDDENRADRASALLAIGGHRQCAAGALLGATGGTRCTEGPTVLRAKAAPPACHALAAADLGAGAITCYFVAVMLTRARAEVLRRERSGGWLAEALGTEPMAEFFHMSGYAFYVWTVLSVWARRCCVLNVWWAWRNLQRERSPRSAAPRHARSLHEHARASGACGWCWASSVASRSRSGLALRADQPAASVTATPTRVLEEHIPAGQALPARRHGAGRQRAAHPGQPRRATSSSPTTTTRYRCATTSVLPDLFKENSGRGGQWPAWMSTACSSPTRCWPSTTRTTCRPRVDKALKKGRVAAARPSPASTALKPRSHFPHDSRNRSVRDDPRAAAGGSAGLLRARGSMARRSERWMQAVYPAVAGQFVLLALAFGCLVWSFVNNDFSVQLVAAHSNTALPVYYRVAAAPGQPRGQPAVLGVRAVGVDAGGGGVLHQPAAALRRARAGRARPASASASCCSRWPPPIPSSACSPRRPMAWT